MIQVEQTPNPESLKFLSEKKVASVGPLEFQKKNSGEIKNDFIKELLGFNGVELVLLSENFISVKKDSNVSWDELKPMIISHLNDYYQKTDAPIISVKGDVKDAEIIGASVF